MAPVMLAEALLVVTFVGTHDTIETTNNAAVNGQEAPCSYNVLK